MAKDVHLIVEYACCEVIRSNLYVKDLVRSANNSLSKEGLTDEFTRVRGVHCT